jgi:translation elongation factor EF-1alpha
MTQFKKGQSGNPAGRPKGSPDKRAKFREAFSDQAEDLISKVIEQALEGDMAALRMCIERIVPPVKPERGDIQIKFEDNATLTEKGVTVIDSVASGNISIDQGQDMILMLHTQKRLVELDELLNRVERLESADK